MNYWECILDTPANEMDKRCEDLAALGVGGFVIENDEDFHGFLEKNRQYWDYVDRELEQKYAGLSRLKFYLQDDPEGLSILETVRASWPELEVSPVADSDWENNWRQYYQPIEVGKRLVIVPEWEEVPSSGRIPVRLDPGLIFGTGSHATTRMCLQALESYAGPGKRVLDLGCGSGILGIAALLLGCDSCLGCDIDPKAPDVVLRNGALNQIGPDRLRPFAGDILSDVSMRRSLGTGYDLVLANIVADVILPLTPLVPAFLKPDGCYICSGIIEGRESEVIRALERSGFAITEHLTEEDWHCFAAHLR